MKLNTNNKISFLFIIFLSIFTEETLAYTSNIINKPDDLYISPEIVYFTFPDGNRLLRFYRPIEGGCNEPNLHLKLLHKDRTLSDFDVQDFSVPKFNFCRSSESKLSPDYIKISNLGRGTNIFYIFYYNISDSDPTAPFGRFVLQVNLEGKIVR